MKIKDLKVDDIYIDRFEDRYKILSIRIYLRYADAMILIQCLKTNKQHSYGLRAFEEEFTKLP